MKQLTLGKISSKIFLIVVLLVILYPFFWLLVSSFKFEQNIISYPPKLFSGHYTFQNYIDVWKRIPLFTYVKNTVIFAGGVVITSLFLDSLAGYALARMTFKGKKTFIYIILLTMMIPFQVFMIPLFIEINKMGLYNSYAGLIIPRMADPFGIFLMRSFFVSLPKDLEEAARIDGLNEFQIYWKIMLPLVKPAFLTLGIFTMMTSWNDLLYPLLLTSSTAMRTLPSGLALFTGQHISYYGPTMAGTMISLLPLLIVYIFAQKYFVEGVAMSGMKD